MSELDMWDAVLGFFMPVVIAFLNQTRWPATMKGLCAFAVCAVAALITVYVRDDGFALTSWVRTLLVVFLTAIATYHFWWKPSTIGPAVEQATSTR